MSRTALPYSASSLLVSRAPAPMVISPRRRSIVVVPSDDSASAAATTSSEANRNASRGRSIVTLHLDLDDLADPQEADRLHHDRPHQHHLAHVLAEEQLHVLGIDHRQR